MNLQGQQIKDTYGGVLNIGSAGLSGSLVTITDGEGNPLPIQASSTTINFTGNITGAPLGSSGTSGTSGVNGSSGASGSNGTSGTSGSSGTSGTSGSAGTSGTSGSSGSTGTSGTSGSSGTSGTSGSTGTSGTSGSSGISGAAGANGSSGTSGTSGVNGANGSSGTSGVSGANGSSGTSGIDGANGSSGTSGTSGANGSSGTSGIDGANGSSGTSGTSGIDGANGSSGTSGVSGANGSSGTSGIDGANGSSGTSGANGSSGTSGANGSSGTSGTSGIDGANGSSGTSGVSGTNGSNGTSGIDGANGSSGTSGANGSSGTSGENGSSGSSGENGSSGSAGTSGTSGVDGLTIAGSSGTSGISGSSGTSGAAGANGSSGTSGVNGSNGTSGDNGSSGTSGVSGTNGSNGTSGESGSSGTSGTSGVNGATGPAGAGSAISSPGNTRLLTSDGTTGGINAQSNLTFTGTVLGVTGQAATYLYDNGTLSGTGTINFNNSNTQSLTLSASTTLTFSNPVIGAVYNLKVIQGGVGSYTITWPGSVSWLGSTPTLQTSVAAVDLFSFIYDGTNYIGASARASMGSSGTSGVSGSSGTNGTSGVNGTSGTSGIDGTSGTSGVNGTSGTSGVNGTSGTSGVNGATGAGSSVTSPGNNRVVTSDGTASGLVAESNFTFDGTVLGVTGQAATYLYANGNFTGTGTINFNNSNVQSLTLTGNTTLTFSNPTSGGVYTLQVVQGGAGGYSITWPGSVIFIDGVPTLQTTIGAVDIISVMYDGSNYYAAKAGTPQGLVYTSATQAVLAATGAATNINIAISPKGNGAFSLQVPDGTNAGGNARGLYAVDLTTRRDFSPDRVASGQDAFAVGWNVRANGEHSAAVGGFNGWANGYASASLAGDSAFAMGNAAIVLGGNGPYASGSSSLAQGYIANAYGNNSICFSGINQTNTDFSMAHGFGAQTDIMGQFARGYYIADRGDSQMSIVTVGKVAAIAPSTLIKLTTDPSTVSTSTTYGLVMNGTNRSWAVNYQFTYVCTVSGGGANDPAVGDTYTEQGTFLAKKIAGTVTATQPVSYAVTHDAYYTGLRVPALSTTTAGSEVKFNVTTGATTNTNTYRMIANISLAETAWT